MKQQKRSFWKRCIAMIAVLSMMVTTIPLTGFQAEAAVTDREIAGTFWASGGQTNTDGTYLIATNEHGNPAGSSVSAAYIAQTTGTGTGGGLGSARIGYLSFSLPQGLADVSLEQAVVTIQVKTINPNLGQRKTKAGLFRVTVDPEQVDPTKAETFPAADEDYSAAATVYSNEWIGEADLGAKTFDVTEMVLAAIEEGSDHVSFRLQTVLSGFSVAREEGESPSLTLTVEDDMEVAQAKRGLRDKIEEAREMDARIYTEATMEHLNTVLASAEETAAAKDLGKEELEEVRQELEDAMAGLVMKDRVFFGSGSQNGSEGTYLIATSSKVTEEGSDQAAAYIEGETGTGTSDPLGSTRIGYLSFRLPEGTTADEIGSAEVHIQVESVNGNMASQKTKAGLFRVAQNPGQVDLDDASTYPAVNQDYSAAATVYSNEWIGKEDLGEKTFDVTEFVKAALEEDSEYVSFRIQTVLSGFSIYDTEDKAPSLIIKEEFGEVRQALDAKIKEAEGIDREGYTSESVEALNDALEEARRVYESDTATKAEIEDALRALTDAVSGLVVDHSGEIAAAREELEKKIAEAQQADSILYTEASRGTLAEAIAQAEALMESENATKEELEEAKRKLAAAIEGLEAVQVIFGASGSQTNTDDTYLIATGEHGNTAGSDQSAALIDGQTATGSGGGLGSTRIGFLSFPIPEGTEAEDIGRAIVSIQVKTINQNLGQRKTKAGLFRVAARPDQVDPTNATTYPAVNGDYSAQATVYSEEWIGAEDLGVKTFDVTSFVKAAIEEGSDYVSFRLQTVLSGFSVAKSGEEAPSLAITDAAVLIREELEARIADAEELDMEGYTQESAKTLRTALEAAQTVVGAENATRTQLEEALKNLNDAIAGLEEDHSEIEAARNALNEKIEEVKDFDTSIYTEESAARFETALEAAKNAAASQEATKEALEEALRQLSEAVSGLEEDQEDPLLTEARQNLADKIAQAEGYEAKDYTEDTFQALSGVLESAKQAYADENANLEQVRGAAQAIEDAIAGLVRVPSQEELLAQARKALEENLREAVAYKAGEYTAESYEALTDAVAAASRIYTDPEASLSEVEQAAQDVADAIRKLVKVSTDDGDGAQLQQAKQRLQLKINGAAAYQASDYTAESYAALTQAVENAKKVWNNTGASLSEVSAASAALDRAVEGLKKLAVSYVGKTVKSGNCKYRITKQGTGSGEAAFVGVVKKKATVKIAASFKYQGITFQVTSVKAGALKGNKKITRLVVGKNVTSIGAKAFYGCKKLRKVEFKGKKVTKIGKGAFEKIKSNASVKMPKGAKAAYKRFITKKVL